MEKDVNRALIPVFNAWFFDLCSKRKFVFS